jgi:hypothetical protein
MFNAHHPFLAPRWSNRQLSQLPNATDGIITIEFVNTSEWHYIGQSIFTFDSTTPIAQMTISIITVMGVVPIGSSATITPLLTGDAAWKFFIEPWTISSVLGSGYVSDGWHQFIFFYHPPHHAMPCHAMPCHATHPLTGHYLILLFFD